MNPDDGCPDPERYPNLARLWTDQHDADVEGLCRRLSIAEDELACAIIERDDALAAFDELAQIVEGFRTAVKDTL